MHDPIYSETLPKSMKWTLIAILSKSFKFDRHLSKAICVSAYQRLTNRFCHGKSFLERWGGGGGGGSGCYSRKQLSIFQVEGFPENPVPGGGTSVSDPQGVQ